MEEEDDISDVYERQLPEHSAENKLMEEAANCDLPQCDAFQEFEEFGDSVLLQCLDTAEEMVAEMMPVAETMMVRDEMGNVAAEVMMETVVVPKDVATSDAVMDAETVKTMGAEAEEEERGKETREMEMGKYAAEMESVKEEPAMEAAAEGPAMEAVKEMAQMEAVNETAAIEEPAMEAVNETAEMETVNEMAEMEAVNETAEVEAMKEASETGVADGTEEMETEEKVSGAAVANETTEVEMEELPKETAEMETKVAKEALEGEVAKGASESEVTTEAPRSKKGGGKRKRGRVTARVQPRAPPKKREEEDVCFICFDGGNLVLCDRRCITLSSVELLSAIPYPVSFVLY